MSNDTMTSKQIMQFFGISRRTLSRICSKLGLNNGVGGRGRKRSFSGDQVQQIMSIGGRGVLKSFTQDDILKMLPLLKLQEATKASVDMAFAASKGWTNDKPNITSNDKPIEQALATMAKIHAQINKNHDIMLQNEKQMIALLQAQTLKPKLLDVASAPAIPPRTDRHELNRIMRRIGNGDGATIASNWHILRLHAKDRLHVDLTTCASHRGIDPLDYAEQVGMMANLLDLARTIESEGGFHQPKPNGWTDSML